ncbi:MAG: DUF2096 family protein [Candidatus Bathyarchaeota archaeon]|nr:DUF2096 family protein [Candidatus Termiticorpusculum sp.]
MGHTLATWKTLEDLLINLRKKNVQIPVNIFEDLRMARSMIDLSFNKDIREEAVAKAEEYTVNVEAYLISKAQEVFEPSIVNEWFKRLKEADLQVDKEVINMVDDRFVVGAPRNTSWVRIEPDGKWSAEYIFELADKMNLIVNIQNDGRVMVYGQLSNIKTFVKQIASKNN